VLPVTEVGGSSPRIRDGSQESAEIADGLLAGIQALAQQNLPCRVETYTSDERRATSGGEVHEVLKALLRGGWGGLSILVSAANQRGDILA
jgi:hypothetical protein